MKEMIRKMAASSVCTLMAAGMTAVSASAKTVASYDASTYNVNIVQKFSRKKHDFSLVDKNNDGKISSTEVNFGKIMYNFSAYKPYGKIKYPVVKKYYTTGTKTIKKKVKGKAVTTKKTVKGKTQYKYYVKSGSKTVFSNKKSNGSDCSPRQAVGVLWRHSAEGVQSHGTISRRKQCGLQHICLSAGAANLTVKHPTGHIIGRLCAFTRETQSGSPRH